MALDQKLRFFYIFSSIFCLILACKDDELFVIRSGAFQGLVVDGTNSTGITVQLYKNTSSQFWKFIPGSRPGLFYIVNNHTGKALDFYPSGGLVLVAKEMRNVLRQQWSLSLDNRITNAENQRNMDIAGANFAPGTSVIVWESNGNQAQELVVRSAKDTDLDEFLEKSVEKE